MEWWMIALIAIVPAAIFYTGWALGYRAADRRWR